VRVAGPVRAPAPSETGDVPLAPTLIQRRGVLGRKIRRYSREGSHGGHRPHSLSSRRSHPHPAIWPFFWLAPNGLDLASLRSGPVARRVALRVRKARTRYPSGARGRSRQRRHGDARARSGWNRHVIKVVDGVGRGRSLRIRAADAEPVSGERCSRELRSRAGGSPFCARLPGHTRLRRPILRFS
jgi:hypothetical protein